MTVNNLGESMRALSEMLPRIEFYVNGGQAVYLTEKIGTKVHTRGNDSIEAMKFMEFLNEQNILQIFIENVFTSSRRNLSISGPNNWINGAFLWGADVNYWSRIDSLWGDRMRTW